MVYERMQTLAESIDSWSSECEPILSLRLSSPHVSAAPVGSTPKPVYLQKLKLVARPETPMPDWHISSPKTENPVEPNCSGWNTRLGSPRAPHELHASLAKGTQNTIREQRFQKVKDAFQPTTNARTQRRGREEGSRLRELEMTAHVWTHDTQLHEILPQASGAA